MTEPTVCPGRENNPWRRARVAYAEAMQQWEATPETERGERPQRPETQPTMGQPIWCSRCVANIRRCLVELDDLAALAQLRSDVANGNSDSDKVTGSKAPPSLSPVQDMLDELYRDLADIEVWHRDEAGYDTKPQRGDPTTSSATALTLTIAWLARHLDAILAMPGAHDTGNTILTWHHRLQQATSSRPEPQRRPARCPRCQLRSLRRRDDGYTGCENRDCGRILSEEQYQEIAEEQAIKTEAS